MDNDPHGGPGTGQNTAAPLRKSGPDGGPSRGDPSSGGPWTGSDAESAAWPRIEDQGDPFHTALAALPEGVIVEDAQGQILASNPAAERILGLTHDELLGRKPRPSHWKSVREDGTELPEPEHPCKAALRTGQPQRDRVVGISRADGTQTWVRVQADPVFVPGGQAPLAVVWSFADITHARHDRISLELAIREAEESSRIKDKFVSLLAHDLRGPIAAAMSMVHLVATDDSPRLSPDQRDALEAVNSRLGQQLELIDGVLSITRLRTGKLRVRKRPVPAGIVLAQAAGLKPLAQRKGVQLVNEIPDEVQVAADPMLFGQVLQNLVSNAIKFTRPGGTVRLFIPAGRPDTIAVQDSGIGIEAARVPDLFRADVKTTTVGTSGERGSGMGLPLSHDIVAAHGGTLRVESEPGKGTTFYADLPPYRPVVLVVDDEADLRALFKRYLTRQGCEVVEAGNGEDALNLLKTVYVNLVVADLQMPRLDGFGLLDAIRRNPEIADTPVIVVTVGTDIETRDRAFALGANDFVTKPIAPHDFLPRARRFLT